MIVSRTVFAAEKSQFSDIGLAFGLFAFHIIEGPL